MMSKPENVKIPLPILIRIIELLENLDVGGYDTSVQCDYDAVYFTHLKKRRDIELREAYAKIVYAKDEQARHQARMNYLQQKRLNDDF